MFEIRLVRDAVPGGGALISAFPSVGMVGTIAGSYIAESLKMERIAYVLSDDIPPAALVQEGVPTYPLRILGHKNLSMLTSEFQMPLPLARQIGWEPIWSREARLKGDEQGCSSTEGGRRPGEGVRRAERIMHIESR